MEVYYVVLSVLLICVQALALCKSTVQTKILVFLENNAYKTFSPPPYRLHIVQKLEKETPVNKDR